MINDEQQNNQLALASKFINNTSRHIFLTGKAGTGKTTFLKHIIKHTYKNTIVAAPTGIAAINAGGITLHSLFLLPFGAFVPTNDGSIYSEYAKINNRQSLLKELKMHGVKRKLLQEMELLIIDEVSMLRADLLDAIDTILRSVRRKNTAFGGVQLLFIGDLLQLPPVVKDNEWNILKQFYHSPFFFESCALKENPPLYIELEKIYRQSDNIFIEVLNHLRNNEVTHSDITLLNTYYKPNFEPIKSENYIKLTTHNYKADELNNSELQKLSEKSYYFKADLWGEFNENAFPLDEKLELRLGAQIMFVKNDPTGAQRFFNGKIGVISSISNDEIEVEFDDKTKPITVEKYEWKNVKYKVNAITNEIEENIAGTFTQYPIKLAWAITVHKSQGLTFDKAIIDIEKAFAPGQVYVALSRLTSLNGLVLSSPLNINSLRNDQTVEAYSKTKLDETTLNQFLMNDSKSFIQQEILNGFNFGILLQQLKWHSESYTKENEKKSIKQRHRNWALELVKNVEPILKTSDKFMNQIKAIIYYQKYDYQKRLLERVISAKEYFIPLLKVQSKVVQSKIEEIQSQKKAKTYFNELMELDGVFYKQIQLIQRAEALLKSAISNTEISRDSIRSSKENTQRLTKVESILNTPLKNDVKSNVKKEKVDTKKLSFDLYNQHKSIDEISKERNLSSITIENHLAYYVGLGLINIKNFVDDEKLEQIIQVSKKLDTYLLAEIKNHLNEDFSYSEIRFAMAYVQNMNKTN